MRLPSTEILPCATYRLQLTGRFGLAEAARIVPYLARLGISHLYASPYLQAAAGSNSGYDVVDYRRINDELGGTAGHREMLEALARAGVGQVVDIVPNHMGIAPGENPFWQDVLENGPASQWGFLFDIDWDPPDKRLHGKVLLPIFGQTQGEALEEGKLRLVREGTGLAIGYFENRFPVSPISLGHVLCEAARNCDSAELAFVASGLAKLPVEAGEENIARRQRDRAILQRLLECVLEESPQVASAIDQAIDQMNRLPERLGDFLNQQHYRLAYWRRAGSDINYRRFFAVDNLAGVRAEDPRVFRLSHQLLQDWIGARQVDGVRVDHVDGLRDPAEYLGRLRTQAPRQWITVEKILQPGETLPEDWPVEGTTGYDFACVLDEMFVDGDAEAAMTELYRSFTGCGEGWGDVVRQCKRKLMMESFGGERQRLVHILMEVADRYPAYRDLTRRELCDAVTDLAACLPVYRTYIEPSRAELSAEDSRHIRQAIQCARSLCPEIEESAWRLLADVLLMQHCGPRETEFLLRFQQLTGPAMAKGVEDTAFYRFNRLISLNEIGGDPGIFGRDLEEFHRFCETLQRDWPLTMLAASTHDSKRSCDVRLRISVLSEVPDRWARTVARFEDLAAPYRTENSPDANLEYSLYQTLVGAWPIELERLLAAMNKSAREAKLQTSWERPNQAYEKALETLIRSLMGSPAFVDELEAILMEIVPPARLHSLAATLVRCTAPGVPDFYQGDEIWNISLVDPDNRRPVDFELRRRLLEGLNGKTAADALAGMDQGLPKLFLIRRALAVRREHPEYFGPAAAYEPVAATGERAEHVIAFLRGGRVLAVAPRLMRKLAGDWRGTHLTLPAGRWRDVFTDRDFSGQVAMPDLLAGFPVALLLWQD